MERLPRTLLFLTLGAALIAPSGFAADHFDSPKVVDDPAGDITDVYAWMSSDASKLNLVMNIGAPNFSDAIQYVFHTSSTETYGGATPTSVDIICAFDAMQKVTCWAGDDDAVTGDARVAPGVTSASGKLQVFAGPRSDPFFFNASGFGATIGIVKGAAGSLTFDAAGCPALDSATSGVLVNQLKSSPEGGPAKNFFEARTVSSLVVAVDKSIVTKGGKTVSVWASTRR